MSGDDSGRTHEDLLAQQAAFFESYFKKGAEFTRELMAETQRLRARLAALEERLADQDRASELERRFQQIEKENNDLAALYVAQSQLHSSLEVTEVLQVISEILLNFVGANRFCLMLLDGEDSLQPMRAVGLSDDASSVAARLSASQEVADCLRSGRVRYEDFGSREESSSPVVVLPLASASGSFGLVAIWGFLQQKTALSDLDRQIFDLIASNGGLALQASRLVSEARQRVRVGTNDGPFERFTRLLEN